MQPIEMTPTETRPTVTGPPVGSPAPAGAVVVGLDVGGTKILGLSIAADGPPRPVRQQSRPTPRSADALIEELAAVAELVADGAAIARVGVGVPGFIDMDGIPRQAPNLPGVVGVDVGALLGGPTGAALQAFIDLPMERPLARLRQSYAATAMMAQLEMQLS